MEKIDNLDKKILNILSKNARIPFKDVAAECNVSRAAIHQRVQHLIEGGVIMGKTLPCMHQSCLPIRDAGVFNQTVFNHHSLFLVSKLRF